MWYNGGAISHVRINRNTNIRITFLQADFAFRKIKFENC